MEHQQQNDKDPEPGNKKRVRYRYFACALFAAGLCWVGVTCVSDTAKTRGLSILRDAIDIQVAPTPLPARPLGTMGRIPAAGEPPVSVFSPQDREAMDNLPVGNDQREAAGG